MNNLPQREFNTIVAGGAALAANAGFINVVSMAGVFPGVTVSHVTGSVSRVAISVVQQDWDTFFLVVSIVSSFVFGAFISGFIVGDNRFKLGANYGFTLFLESGALCVSFLFLRRELIVGEWAASFACGLQNAMVTSYSGLAAELRRLKVHVPILVGFLFGGVLGQVAWIYCREYSLLLPCFFTGGVATLYLSLPYIKDAAEQLKNVQLLGNTDFDYRGDPRLRHLHEQQMIDHYAKIAGRNVDDDIQHFLKDIDAGEPRSAAGYAPVGGDVVEMDAIQRTRGVGSPLADGQRHATYGAVGSDGEQVKMISI
ncbi:hypothetical protein HK105_202525 [Polyrhizophydium stewartii]|uniref:DUF1275 domain-containing protein n=1 Tax=Polyrhizophydium stewartii TaxID=2732419 RepID=A0ABR4NF12_9FUNG